MSFIDFLLVKTGTKNIVLPIFLIAGTVCNVHSQTITIKDNETGKPIETVTLMNETHKLFATTNLNGQADISTFVGVAKIEIRRVGYKIEIKSFNELKDLSFLLSLNPTSLQIDEVVVSATRWHQSSSMVPAKISIISVKDVELNNPQTTADLLGLSGEVFIQKSQQGGGSPMIRGFAANRLLYTVDGVRMNTAIFRSGNIHNVLSLDALSIENTEVFFGPGSIMYGSDAIGGVMSFQTLIPQFSSNDKPLDTGKFVSRYSSVNSEITNHLNIGIGYKKWALVSSFSYSKFSDLKMGKQGPDEYLKPYYVKRIDTMDSVVKNPNPLVQNPSGYSQLNFMQKVRFSPNKKWDFQYGVHYSETSEYSRYDRLIELSPDGLPRSAVWKYGPQIWLMNNLSVTYKNKNRVFDNMNFRVAQQYFEESRIDRNFSGEQRFRLRTNLEKVMAYSINIDFEKSVNKHKFFYGLEYVTNDVTSIGSAIDIRNNNPILVPDRYPNSKWRSLGSYLNHQYTISEKMLIQTGLRFSCFRIKSDFTRHLDFFPFDFTGSTIQNAATTASLGFIYRPADSWKISVNGSTGFRAPNIDDIGKIFDFAGGEVVVPNTSLKAEYAYNGEINISKIIKDIVKLDVTGFYTYLNHAMVRREFQVNRQDSIDYNGELSKVYAIQNAAFGTVYGFNAGIEIKLPSNFSISSRYNYQIGKEEMDNGEVSRSRHAAPAFGITHLNFQTDRLMLQFNIIYSAAVSHENLNQEEKQKPFIYAKNEEGNPFSPNWYTLNLKTMYQILSIFSVSAGIENITDQRYRPYSSGLVAPGRNLIVSLRASF